jgi:hypothetical protein
MYERKEGRRGLIVGVPFPWRRREEGMGLGFRV